MRTGRKYYKNSIDMKKKWIIIAISSILLLSCNLNKTNQDRLVGNTTLYNYELISNGKILSYDLDDYTKYSFSALFTYTDGSGKEYLTFQNTAFFEILFYDLNNTNFRNYSPPTVLSLNKLISYFQSQCLSCFITERFS